MKELPAYKTVYRNGSGETVEKKSRFIAEIYHVESEEEIGEILEATRKKYWDASHSCYAYILGKRQELMRCSDAGEPSGTAGRPMLDVIQGMGLCNVLAVVTRYFGGTLLGTGGLVRAYSEAVREGLRGSVLVEKEPARRLRIGTDYTGVGKILYLLGQERLDVLESEYTDKVSLTAAVPLAKLEHLKKQLTEATSGQAVLEELEYLYVGIAGGKAQIFAD